jgi:hypothetical protein
MTSQPDNELELDAGMRELADRFSAGRPVPAASFRGALGRHLARRDPGYSPRPARLRLYVTSYIATGGVLIALGALIASAGGL